MVKRRGFEGYLRRVFVPTSLKCFRQESHSKSQDAIVSKDSIIAICFHIKALVAKFDPAVKYVKINPGLSFEQNKISLNL